MKKPAASAEANATAEPTSPAMPTQGGSYTRDPATGELTRVEWTEHAPIAVDEPSADAEGAANAQSQEG